VLVPGDAVAPGEGAFPHGRGGKTNNQNGDKHMKTTDKYVGFDVHKDTNVIAVAEATRHAAVPETIMRKLVREKQAERLPPSDDPREAAAIRPASAAGA
jgi:hypothetical protein